VSSTYDAVVVGAGPNGLVAANHLMDAGWSVLLLEQQPEVGGAVKSDREVHPDFVHDTFSAFYPLAGGSRTIQHFELEKHGLRWVHAPAVFGNPFPGGGWALLHRDRNITASLMEQQHPGDGERWLELCAQWDRIGGSITDALLAPFPPVRAGLRALTKIPSVGGMRFVRQMLTPAADFTRLWFGGESPRVLLCGNAGHSDIPLNAPGSGFMGLLLTMLGQTVGYPVPEGGAGMLAEALAARLRAGGGRIHCGEAATSIDVEAGRAVAVRTSAGERYAATHAVVADVVAPHLYGGLVDAEQLPRRTVKAMELFEMDPGTVKVDWALSGPVPWADPPPHDPGTFHVADSVEQMAEALHQTSSQTIPAHPFMLAGQMTTADPTRSPAGTESLWAYSHVPQQAKHDAGGGDVRGVWDESDCERYADRMQARIERLAPGFGSRVLARRVLGPKQLQERNANLIGGGVNGGTAQLHQELIFRPIPGLGRAETPVAGLYLGSASAHPGGGVHGACGMNAARAAIAHRRLRSVLP
jgi:phytoene dehydrogenase-like protein